jgi:APA family basic amino acid/polyamine antiporter
LATADVPVERTMFVRKATGLVKGWSVFDAFIYSAFAINLMALGFGYAFTTTAFLPKGALIAAIILSGLFIVFEVLVYASMIAVMPRAGGDYVWQTRVFGGGVGFVLAATGWWFILWHWVPIYAQILSVEVLQPLLTILGYTGTSTLHADWWPYSPTNGTGIFVASLITAAIATVVVAMGMQLYARVQKWCFYGGMVGLVLMLAIFLTHSKSDFITAYNTSAHNLYGVKGDAFHGLISASDKAGTSTYPGFGDFPFKETFLLLPFMVFYNLWPNWGATLYGEVRGASDFRKNIYAMGGALVFTTVVVVITFAAMAHAIGFETYGIMSSAYWAYFTAPLAIFPYPGTIAAFFYTNELVQVVLILLLSLWFFGWAGSVFLSSTRMIFAAAFDRVLPEWAAKVDDRTHAPLGALALMLLPSIPISALYAYSTKFYSYTLDATLVIAVTYFGTTLAAIVLPWRKPEIYRASPIAKYEVAGVPLVTLSGIVFGGFLAFCLFKWFFDDAYFVNNFDSKVYMLALYVLALVIYVGSRVMRRREGIDLARINAEIPVE